MTDRPRMISRRLLLVGALTLSAGAHLLSGFMWDSLLWVSYRNLSFAGFLGFLSPLLALAGAGIAVFGLRRQKTFFSWVVLAVSTGVSVLLISSMAFVVNMGLPLRTGSDGAVGYGQGQIVELSSRLSAVVPQGWVGELRQVPPSGRGKAGPVRTFDMVPIENVILPGMIDTASSDYGVWLWVATETASPNELLKLSFFGKQDTTRTVLPLSGGGSVTAVVQRGPIESETQPAAEAVFVSGLVEFPGESPLMLRARFAGSEIPDSASDQDAILWLIDFMELDLR